MLALFKGGQEIRKIEKYPQAWRNKNEKSRAENNNNTEVKGLLCETKRQINKIACPQICLNKHLHIKPLAYTIFLY